MPATKDPKRSAARRLVWRRLREFLAAVMPRFSPPEELWKQVERKVEPPENKPHGGGPLR
jgi:hypothetical protein